MSRPEIEQLKAVLSVEPGGTVGTVESKPSRLFHARNEFGAALQPVIEHYGLSAGEVVLLLNHVAHHYATRVAFPEDSQ